MIVGKDLLLSKDGSIIHLRFYSHASVGIEWKSLQIYVDPVGKKYNMDFIREPKADLIFVTHYHADHMDKEAIDLLKKDDTIVFASKSCAELDSFHVLTPYKNIKVSDVNVYSFPAYNITSNKVQYHPKEVGGLGYVIGLGGTNILFAGDTEDTVDLCSLQNIDIAFLPVNQPYTMTIQQVCNVVDKIHPPILYPYHISSRFGKTNVYPLKELLSGICDVRIKIND